MLGFLGIFEKVLTYIPQSLTSAMLAGVLLKFGIALFTSLQEAWAFILSLLAAYVLAKRFSPRYSIVLTVLIGARYAQSSCNFKCRVCNGVLHNQFGCNLN